jgi:SAM-dependent MidA family methyltransferase
VNLREKIEQEIRERGPIPFSRYMEMCLYDPELGYYSRAQEKFGKAGDFYTSSDVHAVFGRLLARQFEEMWRALGSPDEIEVLELGPGRGLFAQDVLDWSQKKFPEFYRALRYTLEERSPSLRARLEERFRERIESGKVALLNRAETAFMIDVGGRETPTGGDARPSTDKNASRQDREGRGFSPDESIQEKTGSGAAGVLARRRALAREIPRIVFANEFFDALPVEVLSEKGSLRISTRDGRFVEEWTDASPDELEFLDHYGVHPTGLDRTEVALLSQRKIAEITTALQRGFLVIIDYGYTREEQLAGRHLETIMTYRQHSASPDPYAAPGEQDITAHANFTALAGAGEHAGMHMHKLLTQSQFLMGIGEATQFADAFEDCQLPQERAKVALQLKHLVTPSGIGETFHVLMGSKGVDQDVLENLRGLSFAKSRMP